MWFHFCDILSPGCQTLIKIYAVLDFATPWQTRNFINFYIWAHKHTQINVFCYDMVVQNMHAILSRFCFILFMTSLRVTWFMNPYSSELLNRFYRNRIIALASARDQPGRTVYPKKYAHGFVVLCFVVVMQSFIMNSHEVFIHIHQGCFAGTGAIVRLPQCQWSKPDGYGKIVCIFLGIYCIPGTMFYHVEVETKQPPFFWRHFQMHFLEWKFLKFIGICSIWPT